LSGADTRYARSSARRFCTGASDEDIATVLGWAARPSTDRFVLGKPGTGAATRFLRAAQSSRAKRGPCWSPRLFKPARGPRVDAHRSIGWPTIGRRPADSRFPVFRSAVQPRDGPSHAGRLARAMGCISFPRSLAHLFLHCRDKLLESERFCEEIIFVFLALREVLLEGLLSIA
jgi:hypothetical protein